MTTPLPQAIEILRQASHGLLFLSETDAPFEPFFWSGAKVEELEARLPELAYAPENSKITSVSVRAFFHDATHAEEWHNDEEKAQVEKFKSLARAIKEQLADARVFCIGEAKRDCFIVGSVEGGCGGLKTQTVET